MRMYNPSSKNISGVTENMLRVPTHIQMSSYNYKYLNFQTVKQTKLFDSSSTYLYCNLHVRVFLYLTTIYVDDTS